MIYPESNNVEWDCEEIYCPAYDPYGEYHATRIDVEDYQAFVLRVVDDADFNENVSVRVKVYADNGYLGTYDFTYDDVYGRHAGVAFMGYPNAFMSTIPDDMYEYGYFGDKVLVMEVTAFNEDASGTCALYLEGYKWQSI